MLSTVSLSTDNLDDLQTELLKKIEISKISRQLKSKLSSIVNKSPNKPSISSPSSVSKHCNHSYSVSKLPQRSSLKKYDQFESPIKKTKHYRYLPPSSPLYTPKGSSRQRVSSPINSDGSNSSSVRNKKMHNYESLDEMVSHKEHRSPQVSKSLMLTPKSKVVRTSRNTHDSHNEEEVGASILMLLATSPSPSPFKAGGNQFMSSPVKVSKSYNEFAGIPSTPHSGSKSFSSPYHNNMTPKSSYKFGGVATPKIQSTNNFAGSNSINSTIIRTPKFNMSDYVNFMSPSPCSKKTGNKLIATSPERRNLVVREEDISNAKPEISKDEETEDEDENQMPSHFVKTLQDDGQETEDEKE